ncbi:MAG: hypothetical protein ABJH85_05210, partial [Paracoccaceae bacterium]
SDETAAIISGSRENKDSVKKPGLLSRVFMVRLRIVCGQEWPFRIGNQSSAKAHKATKAPVGASTLARPVDM